MTFNADLALHSDCEFCANIIAPTRSSIERGSEKRSSSHGLIMNTSDFDKYG